MFRKLFGKDKKKNEHEERVEQIVDNLQDDYVEIEKPTSVLEPEVEATEKEYLTNDLENEELIFEASEETPTTHGLVLEDIVEETIKQEEKPKKMGLFQRLKKGLAKTRDAVSSSIDNLVNGKATIDDDLYEELEEIMISADIGVETTVNIIDELRDYIEDNHIRDPKLIKSDLIRIMKEKLKSQNSNNALNFETDKPLVILVIGVNGVGKTTTIGKLAHNIKSEGKSVTLAAADTFRAAAIQQLTEWANRANVEIITHEEGSDPASVVFDAITSHKTKNKDVLIIDTAGRLHNKKNLMNELEKINRIIDKQYPEATRETLLVLDATTGQNAIYQAKEFNKVADISGLVLTKLDGTAKGGVVFPLQVENNIPVKYIGVGEGIDNLEKFNSDEFIDAMFN
ncbi:MAG: signal recognition particle-docking protein FtsY [Tissierellia bacterium]|nr:signal recognition particle-docking protein FtsY [Tissierellia bacterium]